MRGLYKIFPYARSFTVYPTASADDITYFKLLYSAVCLNIILKIEHIRDSGVGVGSKLCSRGMEG